MTIAVTVMHEKKLSFCSFLTVVIIDVESSNMGNHGIFFSITPRRKKFSAASHMGLLSSSENCLTALCTVYWGNSDQMTAFWLCFGWFSAARPDNNVSF